NRIIHLQRGVKEVSRREGAESIGGREVKIGKLKSTSSKRDVPLNQSAVDAILDLRAERYFGEDSPLISDEHGGYTRPVNFRKRYYRILEAAGLERRGLHTLRHTFATNLVNGVKQPNGTIRAPPGRWPTSSATHRDHRTLLCEKGYFPSGRDHGRI
ncbi:MAG: tyrosine-type recombinase/integrase, partial [Neglectibacter sp.]